ncbi:MAG: UPF0149 family protein [Acidiferrobacteraceae bacterium]
MPAPLHRSLSVALERAGASTGASEVHGLLCGLICAHGEADGRGCLPLIFDGPEAATGTLQDGLDGLAEESMRTLQGSDFEFDLLLPDDDDPLPMRFEAVVSWCQGFTLALLLDCPERADTLAADAHEAMETLLEISASEPVVDEDEASGERDLAEIIEHIRVSVQLVHDDLVRLRATGGK